MVLKELVPLTKMRIRMKANSKIMRKTVVLGLTEKNPKHRVKAKMEA